MIGLRSVRQARVPNIGFVFPYFDICTRCNKIVETCTCMCRFVQTSGREGGRPAVLPGAGESACRGVSCLESFQQPGCSWVRMNARTQTNVKGSHRNA